ncbi:hypothetical protein Bbelb_114440 [Branchiostoma belcheri]|nr:hypothetical protein Bbelb_114440 [Branchiostoma belcheri]
MSVVTIWLVGWERNPVGVIRQRSYGRLNALCVALVDCFDGRKQTPAPVREVGVVMVTKGISSDERKDELTLALPSSADRAPYSPSAGAHSQARFSRGANGINYQTSRDRPSLSPHCDAPPIFRKFSTALAITRRVAMETGCQFWLGAWLTQSA